ncbi:MAG: hypothetical protein GF416_06525 [Candidatus Altiarchaeales archaeon]|nr:hypothetical protein [Candidatus Altiarchaeales archaeon]MBD3416770.1 hypothetical protein [Candidatus Altiarchaeales archaeon]
MAKKVLVTLTDEQYENLKKSTALGETDAEKLRNAFLIYDNLKDLLEVIKKLRE